jgi:hypothetical protein
MKQNSEMSLAARYTNQGRCDTFQGKAFLKFSVKNMCRDSCALIFLALWKVGFVSEFCVPSNVLKIALGRVAKSC